MSEKINWMCDEDLINKHAIINGVSVEAFAADGISTWLVYARGEFSGNDCRFTAVFVAREMAKLEADIDICALGAVATVLQAWDVLKKGGGVDAL